MFSLNDRVALKEDVENNKPSFYRIKKVLEDNKYIVGKCSCRPDLYFEAKEEELLSYQEAKTMLSEGMFK